MCVCVFGIELVIWSMMNVYLVISIVLSFVFFLDEFSSSEGIGEKIELNEDDGSIKL